MVLVGDRTIARRDFLRVLAGIGLGLMGMSMIVCRGREQKVPPKKGDMIALPPPKLDGETSVEKAIRGRRSERDFQNRPLSLAHLSQILWAAQGITDEGGELRAAPSAGAQYPLDVYTVIGQGGAEGLEAGVYSYHPHEHSLRLRSEGDFREDLTTACLGQRYMAEAPLSLIITAEYDRIRDRYGERGIRYAHIEMGHVGENIYLQAEALGMGTVMVGAFYDDEVAKALSLPPNHEPLGVMPIGYPR